ncbi:Lin1244/Lin1753 domain-containing protein [Paludibacter sp.]|uniref:Lin1244/Lin1753 domain-containing protein n=1 Tax=Paludibacter sp. TaxID=1898105 RepID=UPI001355B154|nr:Lin1244/Lin1753 domain-containing protein [Paludibacter sp.]MTK53120.1 DUF4373 domain-containing protein [Paludibacter sp.]
MNYYFSHDYHARHDKKLVAATMKYGLEIVGAYWCIIESLYEEGGYLKLDEYERISYELRTSNDLIKYLIYDSLLFENDGVKFWSNTVLKRIGMCKEKSEKARKSVAFRWKNNGNTDVFQSKTDRNAIKEKENKENTTSSVEGCGIIEIPPDDNVERNLSALNRRLFQFRASPAEIQEVYRLSNYGEIGNPIWGLFSTIDQNNQQIRLPVKFILSRLKS